MKNFNEFWKAESEGSVKSDWHSRKVTLGALKRDTAARSPLTTDCAGSVVARAGSEDGGQFKTG